MAEVKWIKLTTDMFDNRKVKHLRRLPDGNNIVLIWVMLLTMAGRCNAGGMIFLTENIPYTPKMLADELDFEENTVVLALGALEQLNMIVTNNGFFSIAGWEEYQNIEGMDKIREQNRLRQAKFKQKQKLLEGNVTDNVTVTQGNATDIEEDKDLDKEKDVLENTSQKRKRFVPPTIDEVKAYCDERQNNVDAARFIDYYTANGWLVGKNKMKDWKAAVRTWERNDSGVKKVTAQKQTSGFDDFMSQLAAMRTGEG
jgi:predicted phage replisome organizer